MGPRRKAISDQVIVITGATSGIGLATARLAARKGATVVLAARNTQALAQIEADLRAEGARALAVGTDMTKREEITHLADAAEEKFGRIDTWVNNAGTSIFGKLQEVSEEDSRALWEVNFWGLVHGSFEAVERMKKTGGGSLINVGSVASDVTLPMQSMYSSTKHAVKGFTDGLRMELASEDVPVSVTLIKPASIDTPLPKNARNYMPEQPKLPEPVYAPEDVAEAIVSAAQSGVRDVYVGSAGPVFSALHAVLPSLLDWMGHAILMPRQKTGQVAHSARGTLTRPGQGGHVHGNAGSVPTRPGDWAMPLAMGLVGLGLVGLLRAERPS